MISFDFYHSIKNDIIINFSSYAKIIHYDIINITDLDIKLKFRNIGIFPLIVYTGNGNIKLVYYIIPRIINILTKKDFEIQSHHEVK